jgi:hypothetical protein
MPEVNRIVETKQRVVFGAQLSAVRRTRITADSGIPRNAALLSGTWQETGDLSVPAQYDIGDAGEAASLPDETVPAALDVPARVLR